jgi:dienelactone hydrolase
MNAVATSDTKGAALPGRAKCGGGRILLLVVAIGLLCSLALNAVIMVHYRVPPRLWAKPAPKPVLPEIPLREAKYEKPTASLTFTGGNVTEWQAVGRKKLAELLGMSLPLAATPIVREIRSEDVGTVTRTTLAFAQEDGVEVPAFVLTPKVRQAKRPAILSIPGHSYGIVATAGIVADYQHSNALRLAEAGYVVLTMEVRGFGYLAKLGPAAEAMDHGAHVGYALAHGVPAIGMTVRDAAAGLSYLTAREDVEADQLGVVGFSSGGKAAIYLAALDERVKATVASGCVTSHDANFRYSQHDPYEAVPGIARWLEMSDCLGLVAPRALLVHWGDKDNVRQSRSAAFNHDSLPTLDAAKRIYDAASSAATIEKAITSGLGHEFDVEAAKTFLTKSLPLN